jgi:hypothetical protein
MFVSLMELGSMVLDIDGHRLEAKFLRENGVIQDCFTIVKGGSPGFRITAISISGNTLTLTWNSALQTNYRVQRADNLHAMWTTISPDIAGDANSTSWSHHLDKGTFTSPVCRCSREDPAGIASRVCCSFGSAVGYRLRGSARDDVVLTEPVPEESRLSNQLVSVFGVSFSSGNSYVAVVNLGPGHATSGINGIGGSTPQGTLTYDPVFPIVATFFDPAHPGTPAVTDFVGVRIDLAGGSGLSVRLNAYDIMGSLVGFATSPDIGGSTLEISALGIHSVQYLGTADDGGAALDDFTFNPASQ